MDMNKMDSKILNDNIMDNSLEDRYFNSKSTSEISLSPDSTEPSDQLDSSPPVKRAKTFNHVQENITNDVETKLSTKDDQDFHVSNSEVSLNYHVPKVSNMNEFHEGVVEYEPFVSEAYFYGSENTDTIHDVSYTHDVEIFNDSKSESNDVYEITIGSNMEKQNIGSQLNSQLNPINSVPYKFKQDSVNNQSLKVVGPRKNDLYSTDSSSTQYSDDTTNMINDCEDINKKKYLKTVEFLKKSNLFGVTMKTVDLLKRNQLLQKEINKLKEDISNFLATYVAHNNEHNIKVIDEQISGCKINFDQDHINQ